MPGFHPLLEGSGMKRILAGGPSHCRPRHFGRHGAGGATPIVRCGQILHVVPSAWSLRYERCFQDEQVWYTTIKEGPWHKASREAKLTCIAFTEARRPEPPSYHLIHLCLWNEYS